ncbi:MAG: membrane protein insertion efficiency factor YidD [Acholeplasmataceae bacterium]
MKKLAIKLILWYQKNISPNSNHKCRHSPTCSNYALESYRRFNFFKASFLTSKRILTCNPLFKPKYDPVPEKKIKEKKSKLN